MSWSRLLPLVSLILLHYAFCDTLTLTVETKKGKIEGINVPANEKTTKISYDAFLGIPYGDQPDRFQLAKTRTKWSTTLETKADKPPCPQPNVEYSEDCLYLNVYRPAGLTESDKLPVMAFLPGGGFVYSSASSKIYGPDFLLSGKVILVTINYRVGATGFLSLGSKVAPGNLGLHDTLLALHWIQDEISAFGGDPATVTIFGGGSGAVITQFHYLSPLSTGVFKYAISQSGSALASWGHTTLNEARRRALLLAQKLKCDALQSDSNILTCLQKAEIKDIVGNQSLSLSDYDTISGRNIPFVAVLDTKSTADTPFFSDSLDKLIEAAKSRAKPLLSGFTSGEGVLMFSTGNYLKTEASLAAFLPEEPGNSEKVNRIKNQYFNPSSPTLNKIQSLVSIYTDYLFANPAIQVSRTFANFTYGYEFSYDGTWKPNDLGSTNKFYQYKMRAVAHGEDLSYLFYNTLNTYQSLESCSANTANIDMKDKMVTWWTNFAKSGKPDDSWQDVFKGGYFVIDSKTSSKKESEFESIYYNFWASVQARTSSADSAALTPLALFLSLVTVVKSFYL